MKVTYNKQEVRKDTPWELHRVYAHGDKLFFSTLFETVNDFNSLLVSLDGNTSYFVGDGYDDVSYIDENLDQNQYAIADLNKFTLLDTELIIK